MTRDQAVAQTLIWAAILGTPLLIVLALAWGRARDVIAACPCDTEREPSPAEPPYVRGIPQADRYPEETSCAECGRIDCDHGAVALHEAARQAEADWTEWEREVAR